jgi:BirA family biotin operon repressor/biotin-[acetyl-CoA-carboxylase] ligase
MVASLGQKGNGMTNTGDSFSSNVLAQALGHRPFRYFDQVSSTNNVAQKWALEGAPAGAVVIADEQTSGRGRLGRHWQTPPGQALAVSIVLRPAIEPEYLQQITALGGIAVVEALLNYVSSPCLGLKWPNDVLLNGRKVSGVLAEALWLGQQLQAIILGIGINVRVDFTNTSLAEVATSLESHTEMPVNRLELLAHLLNRVDDWSIRLHDERLLATWRKWLQTIGQHVEIQTSNGLIRGLASDVDSAGALLVEDDQGFLYRLLVGDIALE